MDYDFLDENGVDTRFEDGCIKLEYLLEHKEPYSSELSFTCDGRIAGVYFLFDGQDLVYIGKSRNIKDRLKAHRKENTKKFDSCFCAYFPNNLQITDAEERHIFRYYPKYNKEISNSVNEYMCLGKESEPDLPNEKVYFEGVRLNGKLYIDTGSPIDEHELTEILYNKKCEDMKADGEMFDEYFKMRGIV